jgi:sarcosine oxidase subunit beta
MPFSLFKYGLSRDYPMERDADLPPHTDLKPSYDVVIIGGGGHGVATAYHLAKYHGITNVAVLEKGYLGGGNTARNTAVIRSNYLTSEGVRFYTESVRMFKELGRGPISRESKVTRWVLFFPFTYPMACILIRLS